MRSDRPIASGAPAARSDGLVITAAADECLVYDTDRHHLHRLNPTMTAIWHALDGSRDLDDVAAHASHASSIAVDAATARRAIDQLASANLLDSARPWPRRTTRRTFVRGAAAGAVAFPAIVSITAPAAANGISPLDCDPRDDQCDIGFICAGNGGTYPFICREGDACRPACTSDVECQSPNWERSGRGGSSETCNSCVVVCVNPDTEMKETWPWGQKELPVYCGSPTSGTCGYPPEFPQNEPPAPVCGALCDSNDYCAGATDGCTLCLLNEDMQEWQCGQSDRDRPAAPQNENRTLAEPSEPDLDPTPTPEPPTPTPEPPTPTPEPPTPTPEPPTPTPSPTAEPVFEQVETTDTGDSSLPPDADDGGDGAGQG